MRKSTLFFTTLLAGTLSGATPLELSSINPDHREAAPPQVPYKLAKVERGAATAKVVAVGRVQPAASVIVGSQVSGLVAEVFVDFNDFVKQGQPIAKLDQHIFAVRVEQARAEVEVARNAVQIAKDASKAAAAVVSGAAAERARTEADAKRSKIAAEHALRKLERKTVLAKSGSSSLGDQEDARVAYEMAVADESSAKAQVASREAQIEEAKSQLTVAQSRIAHEAAQLDRSLAALRQAEADLAQTVVRAPADGIVIERSVSAGQTVAASFQAPSLFTIGDLRNVSVELAVDEAEIGRIQPGQEAAFSVDAFPDKVFDGRITQVRKAPHTEENVVTYTVIAASENKELLLFPGMTAKAEIIIGQNSEALQVPTAALRYRPQGLPPRSGSYVWVFNGEAIIPVAVQIGSTEADRTEIAGAVEEGEVVVIGDADATLPSSAAAWRQLGVSWIEPVQAALADIVRR